MITDLDVLYAKSKEWKAKWKKSFSCTRKPNAHAWDWTQDNEDGTAPAPDEFSLYHADSSLKHMAWRVTPRARKAGESKEATAALNTADLLLKFIIKGLCLWRTVVE